MSRSRATESDRIFYWILGLIALLTLVSSGASAGDYPERETLESSWYGPALYGFIGERQVQSDPLSIGDESRGSSDGYVLGVGLRSRYAGFEIWGSTEADQSWVSACPRSAYGEFCEITSTSSTDQWGFDLTAFPFGKMTWPVDFKAGVGVHNIRQTEEVWLVQIIDGRERRDYGSASISETRPTWLAGVQFFPTKSDRILIDITYHSATGYRAGAGWKF